MMRKFRDRGFYLRTSQGTVQDRLLRSGFFEKHAESFHPKDEEHHQRRKAFHLCGFLHQRIQEGTHPAYRQITGKDLHILQQHVREYRTEQYHRHPLQPLEAGRKNTTRCPLEKLKINER